MMARASQHQRGWKVCLLIAATYFHFLIFAQFAFLERLAHWTANPLSLKTAMAAMALGGVLFSLLTPRLGRHWTPRRRVRIGLALSALAACASTLELNFLLAMVLSFAIGSSLALLTVTLVSELRNWMGDGAALWKVALGTGIGYWLANLPPVFAAPASLQATLAAIFCGIAFMLAPQDAEEFPLTVPHSPGSLLLPLASFTALVWLDSAAFYIIQHAPQLKAGTWQGNAHLWTNGLLHCAAALIAAWLLTHFRSSWTLAAAFLLLATACILLRTPDLAATASIFYPCGVSLYSVALVAYPSLLDPASSREQRARRAGWLYAGAGWIGSGLGIGMAEHLHRVPWTFVAVAGVVVLAPALVALLRTRALELALLASLLLLSATLARWQTPATTPALSAAQRGRAVYISEGCIHCHSQYVRPGTADVLLWGPVKTVAAVHQETPPLIGNRRQGPDLAEVGARRSALWLKMHLIDPAGISGGSIMPSYAVLFRDQRGEDLVAYLASLRASDPSLDQLRRQWQPSAAAKAHANVAQGHLLYRRFCASCHTAQSPILHAWKSQFQPLPPAFEAESGPRHNPQAQPASFEDLARLIKFGLPGTDMPGHEVLTDEEISSITLWLAPRCAGLPNLPHPLHKE